MTTYRVAELPDPTCATYQAAANGAVREAIWNDTEQWLRTLASLPPRAVTAEIRFLYRPTRDLSAVQSRLQIYFIICAREKGAGAMLRSLIESGPLSRFYHFAAAELPAFPFGRMRAACDVVRRAELVTPLYDVEHNRFIPSRYLTIRSLEPSSENDYLTLDCVLGNITEPVAISICFEPAEVSSVLDQHTRYLARLARINRPWDDDASEQLGETGWPLGAVRRSSHCEDPLADDILRQQRRFHETLQLPHLHFHIRVWAATMAAAHAISSVVAGCAFRQSSYRTIGSTQGDALFPALSAGRSPTGVTALPVCESLWNRNELKLYGGLTPLVNLAPVDELAAAIRLPVASISSPTCIRKSTDPPNERVDDLIVLGIDQAQSGSTAANGARGVPRGIPVKQLVKHGLITGMSGYGKTVSQMNIMIQLWRRGIPFMVLETAKTEYRALKQHTNHSDPDIRNLAKALQVYTVGDESVSPFRHNPLEIRPGISRNAHIENILDCFKASMPFFGPLVAILGEALEHVYEQHPDPDKPPALTDLLSEAVRVLQEKGYSGDISSDLRAAIDVRLGTLTRRAPGAVLQCRRSAPSIDHLMRVPSIIEMDRLTPDLTCLMTLFLLTSIREFLQTSTPTRVGPRFVVILEEAHNVVGRNTNTAPQDNVADPKAHAAEFICRMLAEVRGLGVGLILANQLPSAVASEVTKSTAWKVAFRQIANDDREDLGGTMLFGPSEMEEIARLEPGEAFLMTEGYHSPRRIWAERLHERLDLDNSPSDTQLARLLRREGWFRAMTKQRRMAELTQLEEHVDQLEQSIALRRDRLDMLIDEHPAIVKAKISSDERHKRFRRLADQVRVQRQRVLSLRDAFGKGPYRAFATESAETDSIDPTVKKKRAELVRRVKKTIYPKIDRFIDVADKRIELKQPSPRRMQADAKKK